MLASLHNQDIKLVLAKVSNQRNASNVTIFTNEVHFPQIAVNVLMQLQNQNFVLCTLAVLLDPLAEDQTNGNVLNVIYGSKSTRKTFIKIMKYAVTANSVNQSHQE